VDARTYLQKLASSTRLLYVVPAEIRLRMQVDPVLLSIDDAIPCGLIVNELLTNAFKHAFPAGTGGSVDVTFRSIGGRRELTVRDDGVGLAEPTDRTPASSLGMRIVRALSGQLRAKLEVRTERGTCVRLGFER